MRVYEALSLMIAFGILVATIILACKEHYRKEKDRHMTASLFFNKTIFMGRADGTTRQTNLHIL